MSCSSSIPSAPKRSPSQGSLAESAISIPSSADGMFQLTDLATTAPPAAAAGATTSDSSPANADREQPSSCMEYYADLILVNRRSGLGRAMRVLCFILLVLAVFLTLANLATGILFFLGQQPSQDTYPAPTTAAPPARARRSPIRTEEGALLIVEVVAPLWSALRDIKTEVASAEDKAARAYQRLEHSTNAASPASIAAAAALPDAKLPAAAAAAEAKS